MTDAGKFLTDYAGRIRGDFVRRRFWPLVVITTLPLVTAVGLALAYSFLRPTHWSGTAIAFCAGASVTGALSLLLYGLRLDGAQNLRDGAQAEKLTARVLRPLKATGWAVFDDIQLDRRNIDHALIGERGAIAVETKWTTDEVRSTHSGLVRVDLGGRTRPFTWPLEHARWHARDLRLLLLAAGVRTKVVPVLVLWGPRLTGMQGRARWIDGVLVAKGAQAEDWLNGLMAEPLDHQEVRLAVDGLTARKSGREVKPPTALPQQDSPPPTDPEWEPALLR